MEHRLQVPRKKSRTDVWLAYLGVPLALLVYALLYTMDTPAGLTVQGKVSLAVFMFAFILWVSEALPTYATALLTVVLLTLSGAWDEKSILGVLGYDVIWLMIAAFIITSGMEKTGFARRIALWLVITFGRTASRTLITLIVANFILAFIVPSTTARAAVMLPIVLLVAQTYGATPGHSNFARAMLIQEIHANNISTSGILTATASQILAVGLIQSAAGRAVSWLDWLAASMPVALATMVISLLVGMLLFPSEVKLPQGQGIEELKRELAKMGSVSATEWKTLGIFALTIFLWASGPWHVKLFGFRISPVMVAVLVATLLYLPFTGLLTWKETQIPWDLMLFSAGAYAAGISLERSGAASWALDRLFAAFPVRSMSFPALFALAMFVSSFSHMVFTSKTVRTLILVPAMSGLARAAGLDPITLALPAAFTIADAITLPPNCKPNLIFYSTGHFTVLQQLSYGVLTLVGKVALLTLAAVTWYRWIGIVP